VTGNTEVVGCPDTVTTLVKTDAHAGFGFCKQQFALRTPE